MHMLILVRQSTKLPPACGVVPQLRLRQQPSLVRGWFGHSWRAEQASIAIILFGHEIAGASYLSDIEKYDALSPGRQSGQIISKKWTKLRLSIVSNTHRYVVLGLYVE
jgi:hypothetical protein